MNSMERSLRYKFENTGKSALKFWIVIIIVDIASIILNLIYGSQNTFYLGFTNVIGVEKGYSLFGVNLLPILIYFIVSSFTNYYEDFSRMRSFSITRDTIIKANLASNIMLAFIFAVIQGILMKIDPFVMSLIDKKPLYEFFLFNTQLDNIIFIISILFVTFLTFTSLWQLIASLNYKYGAKIWILFLALFAIANNVIINSYTFFDLVFPGNWLNMQMTLARLLIYTGFIIFSQISVYIISKTISK